MSRSIFPTTQSTVLLTLVGGRDGAVAHANTAETARILVMERYAEPLAAFVRGSSLARLGEPAEIVNGFFASRLSDAAFLQGWARSGMRLRRWLMNGILFYGQGLARDRMRAERRGSAISPVELDSREGSRATGEKDFERAWSLALVREATARVEQELIDEGRSRDFEVFRRHTIDGQPYAAFAREVGKSAQQCAGVTRLVAQRVRAKLAELLAEEGVCEHEVDEEIARIRGML